MLFFLLRFLDSMNEIDQKNTFNKNACFNVLNFDFANKKIRNYENLLYINHGKKWSLDDEILLEALCENGKSFIEFIHVLKRKPKPIENRMNKLGWYFLSTGGGSIDLCYQSPLTNEMTIVQNYNPKNLLNASIRHEDKFFSDLLYIDFIYPVISRDQKYLTLEAKINDTKKLIFIDPSRRYYKLKVPKNLSNPQIHIKNDFLGECSFNIEDVIRQNKEILFLYEIDRELDTSNKYEHS